MYISKIKKIIAENNLTSSENLLAFLDREWGNQSEKDLRDIAEYANANRQENSAFYTDEFIIQDMIDSMPMLDKDIIKVLEPSVGIGNFILPFIDKFANKYKSIIIDLNDIDPDSLKVTQFFISKHSLPQNVTIRYTNFDFLADLVFSNSQYDYVIGNPPFQRITSKQASQYGNTITNLAGQFLLKAMTISNVTSLVMPKNLLATSDYKDLRELIQKRPINTIIDFGEKGFKGVLIETIAITIGANNNGMTNVISYIDDSNRLVPEEYITSQEFPVWLLYRNEQFDNIAKHMTFNIFSVFRDRQVTNSILQDTGPIKVYKSQNIKKDGSGLIDIPGYNKFISLENSKKLSVMKYYDDTNVYLVPNMTYYPRMIKKADRYIVNGSVAILKLKKDISITEKQRLFFSSDKFRNFYLIARNKGTRSLNIDRVSVFWFGKYRE